MIVESFEDDALLVKRAKESLVNEDLPHQLMEISGCYGQLPDVIERVTKQYFTIREANKVIEELRFEEDPLGSLYKATSNPD